ncbi:MAG: riboflavin biosynthesis protein RibF [Firmicutes bacterium]|nr:riboflavin biosynthesis protein RibF [Bacillota bacterium]
MEIIGLDNQQKERTVVVLGAFDGIHKGHISLIDAGRMLAKAKDAKLAIMTFLEHPDTVLKNNRLKMLTTQEEKLKVLQDLGVEIVYLPTFVDIAWLSATRFFNEILIEKFGAVGLVAGPNFHFGKKARGNSSYLKFLGTKNNIPVFIGEAIRYKDRIISSTMIRRLIKKGQIELVNSLLGRRFTLTGEVIKGEGRGRKLKMPTANINIPKEKLLPPCGVYLTEAFCENKSYFGLLSISDKPTFHEKGDIVVEVYLFNTEDDLYGKSLSIELIRLQREIFKYNSAKELMDQVALDIKEAKHYMSYYL